MALGLDWVGGAKIGMQSMTDLFSLFGWKVLGLTAKIRRVVFTRSENIEGLYRNSKLNISRSYLEIGNVRNVTVSVGIGEGALLGLRMKKCFQFIFAV